MAAFLGRDFTGAGYGQVAAGPEPDVVRQSFAGTVHEVRDALEAGQAHIVAYFFRILVLDFVRGRIAGQKTLDHEL